MGTIELLTVPIIVSIVYGAIELLKKAANNNENTMRFIPLVAAVLGAAIGIAAFFTAPEIMPASNAFVATLMGGASGLAATGTNQVFKQLTKKDDEDNGDDKAE